MRGLLALVIVVTVLISGTALAVAQESTPTAVGAPITFTLVERNINSTEIDLGESGPSAGDLIVWGPNPLYDDSNEEDTGATSQGFCVVLHETNACVATETVIFPDGSTLAITSGAIQDLTTSVEVIVGGSGQYRGATGTVTGQASDDQSTWTKTYEIYV